MSLEPTLVLKLLADTSSLEILDYIARSYPAGQVNGTFIPIPITKTSLTRRQYYRRLSNLAKAGLIISNNRGEYAMTLFGRLVYAQIVSIKKLVKNYWKIQAVSSIKMASSNEENSDRQLIDLADTLIQDDDIKALLLSSFSLATEQNDIFPLLRRFVLHRLSGRRD